MSNMRSVLVDVLVALLILIFGGIIFARIAGVQEGETAPDWAQFAPLVLAMIYLGWRTLRRGRQRREAEAEMAEAGPEGGAWRDGPDGDRAADPPMDDYEWRSRLESSIRNLGRDAFEQFSIRILGALAVVDVRVERIAFDGAVECLGVHDDEERGSVYAIFRRSFGSLGANQIRDLRASMEGKAAEGLFISNGEFSSSAIDEADGGEPPIELVDGDELLDLMHTNRFGLIFDELGRVTGVDDDWFRGLARDERVRDGD
ncbi:MAG: restriction endonuclease [Chloroflexota bacterium]|nr:restriction endonuclease [Chloroflexota bacterium]